MSDEQQTGGHDGKRLTRLRLFKTAGAAAATAGLAGCATEVERRPLAADVDAPQLSVPPAPTRAPQNCQVFSFFVPGEARTVDAITARLIPGDPSDPGAREACVVGYIDGKLAGFDSFATPTYFRPPFAKPVANAPAGEQAGAKKQILVTEADLPRYGFQSGLTPQETYRGGLEQLDRYTRAKHGAPFSDLPDAVQDAVLELLEKANPSPPGVARKQKEMADPRKALKNAKAKHQAELASPEQKELAKYFEKPSAYGFFSTVQDDTNEGFLADPAYGGNRDFAGWKLVGYPGAQRAWTPHELTHGPNRRHLQDLAELPPQHPGVPQKHVILPISGTRRAAR